MSGPKRIFIIGDFKDESPQSIRIERRHWLKGFVRLGHDVQRFSYRNIMLQMSPLRSKRLGRLLRQESVDKTLTEHLRCYHPDIVLILSMKDFGVESVKKMRQASPQAVFVGRDVDWHPQGNKERMAIGKKMDLVIATNAGTWLNAYRDQGVARCAFIPCPCDPDIQRPYEAEERFKADIIFTGKSVHSRHEVDEDRAIILQRLSEMPNARIYGALGNPKIEGIDCFRAISGAKIALSINAVNNVRLCHSDRLVNCLSCGTFTLAKRVPDSDLLFKDGEHLRYFDSADEFFELADWYLKHDAERKAIAKKGMERAHSEFNCTKMAQHILDLVNKGSYDAPWAQII